MAAALPRRRPRRWAACASGSLPLPALRHLARRRGPLLPPPTPAEPRGHRSCRRALAGQGDKGRCQGASDSSWQIPQQKRSARWRHRNRTGFGSCGITSSKGCAREKSTPRAYLCDSAGLPKNTGRQRCVCLNAFVLSKLPRRRKSWIFIFCYPPREPSNLAGPTSLPQAWARLGQPSPRQLDKPQRQGHAALAPTAGFQGRDY